jgi:hypothetical protein
MQSFFVATQHFSVQNRRMQEENKENQSETPEKKGLIRRMGILNIMFGTLFFVTLITAVGAFAYQYRNIPTSKWGHYASPTPWVGEGIVVSKVKCGWAKMLLPDHATRKNKYFYTPYIGIELGECTGSGVMMCSFRNEEDRKVGEDMQLRYKNGQFIPLNKTFYKSDGKIAFIYFGEEAANVESYDSLVEYERHFMDVKGKLKKFIVKYVTDDEQRKEQPLIRTLGQSTVPKQLNIVEE